MDNPIKLFGKQVITQPKISALQMDDLVKVGPPGVPPQNAH